MVVGESEVVGVRALQQRVEEEAVRDPVRAARRVDVLDVQREVWPTEDFELARSMVDSEVPEDDLFAGIRTSVAAGGSTYGGSS